MEEIDETLSSTGTTFTSENPQNKRGFRLPDTPEGAFSTQSQAGPEVAPAVFQPLIEPEEGQLCAISSRKTRWFSPGATNTAPMKLWDEWYREYRIWSLGRVADIESIEITVIYHWCYSFANLYESGLHYSGRQD